MRPTTWLLLAILGALIGAPHAQNLSVTLPPGCTATPPTVNVTCGGAPVPPSGCSIAQNPPGVLPVGGGQVTLSASCSSGTPPLGWSWTGGFAHGLTTAQVIGNVPVTTGFTASASNGGGSSPSNLTVQVQGSGPVSCTGYANTRLSVMPWPASGKTNQVFSINAGGFGAQDAYIVQFTTGAAATGKGEIQAVEYQSNPSNIWLYGSSQPCDLSHAVNYGQTVLLQFGVGSGQGSLAPNTTYYLNFHHDSSCSGVCNIVVNLTAPQ